MSGLPRLKVSLAFVAPLAFLLVIVGCAGAGAEAPQYAFTPVAEQPEERGRAPDFQVSVYQGQDVLGGREMKFSELLGKQPIVLNFWAGLCPPCRAEMPDLQAMYNDNREKVLLFGLDVGPSLASDLARTASGFWRNSRSTSLRAPPSMRRWSATTNWSGCPRPISSSRMGPSTGSGPVCSTRRSSTSL